MLGLSHTVHWALTHLGSLASSDGRWMTWNLLLALVPIAMARPVLEHIEPQRFGWWLRFGAFAIMLPNSAYVVSDVVHLFDHVRNGATNLELAAVIVPCYLAYMAVGFGGYVYCVDRIRLAVRERQPQLEFRAVLFTHALCAFGIYLGRVVRINSWDVVAAPGTVAAGLRDTMHKAPFIFIGFMFVAIAVLSTLVELTVDGYRARLARVRAR